MKKGNGVKCLVDDQNVVLYFFPDKTQMSYASYDKTSSGKVISGL